MTGASNVIHSHQAPAGSQPDRPNHRVGPVYGRSLRRWTAFGLGLCAWLAGLGAALPVQAQSGDQTILDAREAFRKRDRNRLAAARAAAMAAKHPLAAWVDYWDMNLRIGELRTTDVEEFYTRWKDTYLEDRFRNDWLLELGRRRDWTAFAADFPRFRMNDDREVTCYSLLIQQQQKGSDVHDAALAAWLAQPDADTGCLAMAGALFEARQFTEADIWRKARFAVDAGRPKAARQAIGLLGEVEAKSLNELLDSPARFLSRKEGVFNRLQAELATLALMRMATNDPATAATQLGDRWERKLPKDLAAWAWAMVGKQSAINLLPEAHEHFQRAAKLLVASEKADKGAVKELDFPDDTLAWKVRSALRAPRGPQWGQVLQAIAGMTPAQQRDATWVYWKARGLQAQADSRRDPLEADAMRVQARELLESIAGQFNFYGKLASEDLGRPIPIPPSPAPLTAEERAATVRNPGLNRALSLIAMGLRGEGDREWNFTLRGMDDRQLLAAAQWACDREVWKTCINTSDRTKLEIDLNQRFPMPFRREVLAQAQEIGLDPAYVYGLIRQESRFIMDARSSVGASGLMQLMPATARWTARRLGLSYSADLITDRDTNLKLGTTYLKLVLDDLGGSQAMAAAAYNAGPSRPRRWREGPTLETAAWAESIPFNETRDYVKKVLSNATYYAALLGNDKPSLKTRMGKLIGPHDPETPAADRELP